MPTAVRETVMLGLLARLAAANYAGLTVERDRREDVPPEEMPRAILFDETRQRVIAETTEEKRYELFALVEGHVTGATDAAVASALNALVGAVQAAIEADPTLGGAALGAFEATSDRIIDEAEGHRPIGVAQMAVSVRFRTSRASPYS